MVASTVFNGLKVENCLKVFNIVNVLNGPKVSNNHEYDMACFWYGYKAESIPDDTPGSVLKLY